VKNFITEHLTWTTVTLSITLNAQTDNEDKDGTVNQLTTDVNS